MRVDRSLVFGARGRNIDAQARECLRDGGAMTAQ